MTETGARSTILASLRRSQTPSRTETVSSVPLDRPPPDRLLDHFEERARSAGATVTRLTPANDLGTAVADYLRSENLPARVCIFTGHTDLQASIEGHVELASPDWIDDGITVVGPCVAGVAETGTLVITSGAQDDPRLNYIAETHIAVVGTGQIVAHYEDAWELVALATPSAQPRLVSFITGPSRTADIEQTIERGAHGPRRLHIMLVEENA